MNELIHHNKPPEMVELISDVTKDVNNWMSENPVIRDEDTARQAKLMIDRAKLGIADLESERDSLVRPLNEKLKEINHRYKGPKDLLRGVLNELEGRLTAFILLEERKRILAAEEATRKREALEQIAREAEERERQALDEAAKGVLGIDVAAHKATADKSFEEYKKAEHQEAIKERDIKVRIGGGLIPRAIGVKDKETLYVTDAIAAIKVMGVNAEIEEAIKRAAKAYRKLNGCLPDGIETSIERGI